MNNSFLNKLKTKWNEGKFICVGLDSSDFSLLQKVVDQTYDYIAAYKINSAFFEAEGVSGWESLKKIIQYIQTKSADIPIILDAKKGDIGNTNEAYVKAIFDELRVDGVTVNPYLGQESLKPFLEKTDKGIFVLVKTSNPGSGEFQDLDTGGEPLYQVVAEHVKRWNTSGNLAVVVGATYPKDLEEVRKIVGDMPILIPGIGAQGGDLEETVKAGGREIIINSSRAILNAPDPGEAVVKLNQEIRKLLK